MHPLMFLVLLGGLWSALSPLSDRYPAALPWVFGLSAAAAVVRAWQVESRDDAPGSRRVDHRALRNLDFRPYGPWLRENVRGHDAVVEAIARGVQRGLELSQPGRSLGSFLLVGPTGTGKTFLSLMTAKALWPDHEAVVLRMNQYKSPGDIAAILGAPGRGADGLGALTGAVLEQPHRVVLLDEVDKCHPDVLHGLFDALDGARGREKATGQLVDYSGCLFFATSNAGVDGLRSLADLDEAARMAKARDALAREAGFDKAFLARFTEILLMDALAPRHVAEIACLLIGKQWREQGVEVSYLAPELLAQAVRANEEFGPYGVRQLAHCVRRLTDGALGEARRLGYRRVELGWRGGALTVVESREGTAARA